jgi:hypothetical protein
MLPAFCVTDRFVAEGAKRRMAAGGPPSEGHITDERAPNPTWARSGGQFTGPLNLRVARNSATWIEGLQVRTPSSESTQFASERSVTYLSCKTPLRVSILLV